MILTNLSTIEQARQFTATLRGSGSEFFDVYARELIAQAIFTLASSSNDWGTDQLLDQIAKPRDAFNQQGFADDRADKVIFGTEARHQDAVRATAAFIITYNMPPIHRKAA